jgi:hypothetical protein
MHTHLKMRAHALELLLNDDEGLCPRSIFMLNDDEGLCNTPFSQRKKNFIIKNQSISL